MNDLMLEILLKLPMTLLESIEVVEEGIQVSERLINLIIFSGSYDLALFTFLFLLINIINFGFDTWNIL
jgi:hypothetical protein